MGVDRGSAVIETVLLVPALMLFVALVIFAGRVVMAQQAVQSAAAEAARAASISRTAAEAHGNATAAASSSLGNQQLHCASTSVSVDTSGFAAPAGTPAQVSATLTCVVDLSDLGMPLIPGTTTVTAQMSSPLDTYRTRSG